MSFTVLQKKINEKKNPTVVGLDPKLEYVPKYIINDVTKEFGKTREAVGEALFRFNKEIIDSCFDLIPAIKPQSAYYEMYGLEGLKALWRTIEYGKSKGLYIILDGKRNDIGATAEAYAAAYLGGTELFEVHDEMLNADSLTVNPYLGIDGVKPFIDMCCKFDKSIFVLVKTSNKSSGDFQDIIIKEHDIPLYEHVANNVMAWGEDCNINKSEKFNPVGAVVGATYPEQLARLRIKMKNTFFLIPGYGAQGGTVDDIKNAFDKDGEGAIINSSRAIMCAYMKTNDEENFGKCAREEVINMRNAIMERSQGAFGANF